LKAAFVHVLADALTSVLAIAALFSGKYYHWSFMDPAVSIWGTCRTGKRGSFQKIVQKI